MYYYKWKKGKGYIVSAEVLEKENYEEITEEQYNDETKCFRKKANR